MPRPASPQTELAESGDSSSPGGGSAPPQTLSAAWKTPGQRPDLNKCTLQGMAMVEAYVLIQAEVGRSAEVARAVGKIPGVRFADEVIGPYDVIVRADAADIDGLGKLIVAKVQAVGGVNRTLTCPVVHL